MTIIFDNVTKVYGTKTVISDFNLSVEDKRVYQITGEAGTGKSTVLMIFLGEVKPDSGRLSRMGDYKYPTLQSAYVPQQSQFREKKSAVWHVKKAHRTVSTGRAIEELSFFLPEEKLKIPMSELTGSEKRCVEIVRALCVPADFIVLDEPFYSMDDNLQKRALSYVLDKQGSRPVLIATRNELPIKDSIIVRL